MGLKKFDIKYCFLETKKVKPKEGELPDTTLKKDLIFKKELFSLFLEKYKANESINSSLFFCFLTPY